MASIDRLKGIISGKGGIARPNLFNVHLPSRTTSGKIITTSSDPAIMTALCMDANMPGRQTLTRDRVYGLQRRKIAYGFAQDDVSMTFLLTNDYLVKKYFENWKQLAVNQNSLEINYHEDYVCDVTIDQLDTNENIVYSCKLKEAFPTTLQTIQFNNEPNGILQLNVQLSYTNWTSDFKKAPEMLDLI